MKLIFKCLLLLPGMTLVVTKEDNCNRTTKLLCKDSTGLRLDCGNHCDWYKDNDIILNNGTAVLPNKYEQRIGVNNITLIIYNTDFVDNGEYRCSVGTNQSNYISLKIGEYINALSIICCGKCI